jgi:hypothetical protein
MTTMSPYCSSNDFSTRNFLRPRIGFPDLAENEVHLSAPANLDGPLLEALPTAFDIGAFGSL